MESESQDKSRAINEKTRGKNKGITTIRGNTGVDRTTSKEQLHKMILHKKLVK